MTNCIKERKKEINNKTKMEWRRREKEEGK